MFPSLRVALSGLEKDAHYCVVLEMAPVSECRYKFSGSQWVPAGGAEPQSAQRMYLHPDSPALGSHWQAQPVIFNKAKLTNNTLDNNGHVSILSSHPLRRLLLLSIKKTTHQKAPTRSTVVYSFFRKGRDRNQKRFFFVCHFYFGFHPIAPVTKQIFPEQKLKCVVQLVFFSFDDRSVILFVIDSIVFVVT